MVFVMTLERVRGRGAVVSVGRALRRESLMEPSDRELARFKGLDVLGRGV